MRGGAIVPPARVARPTDVAGAPPAPCPEGGTWFAPIAAMTTTSSWMVLAAGRNGPIHRTKDRTTGRTKDKVPPGAHAAASEPERPAGPPPADEVGFDPASGRLGGREDDGDAFVPDPGEGRAVVPDDLAQVLAEDFLIAATSGEEVGAEVFDQVVPEDLGDPGSADPGEPEFGFGEAEVHPVTARPTAPPVR